MRSIRRRPRSTAIATMYLVLVYSACGWGQDAPTESTPEALNRYADAANFQNNGEFALAAEEWETFLKQHPKDPLVNKARHYAGVCYLQSKDFDKAATHFEMVLKADPKFELAEDAYLNLGWCRYSTAGSKPEMYAKAVEAFSALVKQFDKGKYSDQAFFYLGEAFYAQDAKPKAIAAYRRLVDDYKESSLRCDGLYALGVTYEEVQQYGEAGKIYDLFLKECGESALMTEVRMRKAETVLQGGDVAAAEKMFGETAAVPDFASADHALSRQAFCAAKQGKFAAAADLYAKLATAYPESSYLKDAVISAGRSYYRASDFAKAVAWLQKAVAADEANATEAAHWICRIHLNNQEPAKAITVAEQQLPKSGASAYLVNLKLDQADGLYEIAERRPEAAAKYAAIAEAHPDHTLAPQALYNAAFACMELEKYAEGLKHAAAFVAKYPEDRFAPDTKYVAADCHLKKGEAGAAEAGYRELVENYADHAEIDTWQVRFGLALYKQEKHKEAIAALQPVVGQLKKAEHAAEGHFLIGASQFQLDNFQAASTSLIAALASDAKWRQADETLLFLSRSQYGESRGANDAQLLAAAKTTVAKLIGEFPQSSVLDQAHFRLGEYSYAAGDYAGATAAYQAVVGKWPDSTFAPYAHYGQGWSGLKSKQYAASIASFTELIDKFARHQLVPDAYFARGMSRRQAGEYQSAIDDVQFFLKSNPAQPQKSDALYERGLAEVALKQFAQATATLEAILAENNEYRGAAGVLYELGWAYKQRDQADSAVKSFAKLAAEHEDSQWAGEANLHVAEDLYDKDKYAEAVPFYTTAKTKSKPGEVAERAIHKLGWAQYRIDKFDAALAEFDAQLKNYPDGTLAADGTFMKAESLFKLRRYAEALPVYTAASAKPSADEQKQVLTLLHGGQCASQLKKWDESLALLARIPKEFAASTYLAEAYYELGWAKQNQDKVEEALQDYAQAVQKSRGHVGARAQFMIGQVYFAQKKFPQALRAFKRVMYGYGDRQSAEPVKEWQAMCAYEAGRCSEGQVSSQTDSARKTKLIQDAITSYKYLVDRHPRHDRAEIAKKRIAELSKLAR